MRDLLYLKDEQIKDFIQLLYYAYRETYSDPKDILSKKFFGSAHLRALNLIESNPGISLGELIYKLKITKQSINRVIRDLLKSKMVKQLKDDTDTRKKKLYLDKEGKTFFDIPWDTIVEYGIADVIATEEVALEQLKAFGSSFEELFNDPDTDIEIVA